MKIKICGVTHPDDAEYIANLQVEYMGVIFAESSKRFIHLDDALQIKKTIANSMTQLVGVFLEAPIAMILATADRLDLSIIQLHGRYASSDLTRLSADYTVFYAMHQTDEVRFFEPPIMPLYDYTEPGSGKCFDWFSFAPPHSPWILAGGLHAGNVQTAIQYLHPSIVDVASGVEIPGTVRKNPRLLKAFVQAVREV